MSVIDTPTRTHNDSIDVLVDNAAHESVVPRWVAPHVAVRQCADLKLRTASVSPLNHFGENVVNIIDTCTWKLLHIRCTVSDVHCPILSVGRFIEMHDDLTAFFTNTHAVQQFYIRTRDEIDEAKSTLGT